MESGLGRGARIRAHARKLVQAEMQIIFRVYLRADGLSARQELAGDGRPYSLTYAYLFLLCRPRATGRQQITAFGICSLASGSATDKSGVVFGCCSERRNSHPDSRFAIAVFNELTSAR